MPVHSFLFLLRAEEGAYGQFGVRASHFGHDRRCDHRLVVRRLSHQSRISGIRRREHPLHRGLVSGWSCAGPADHPLAHHSAFPLEPLSDPRDLSSQPDRGKRGAGHRPDLRCAALSAALVPPLSLREYPAYRSEHLLRLPGHHRHGDAAEGPIRCYHRAIGTGSWREEQPRPAGYQRHHRWTHRRHQPDRFLAGAFHHPQLRP